MDAAHRLWHLFLRTSKPHELQRDDGNNENGVQQIYDNAVPLDGVFGTRPQEGRNFFTEVMSDHCCRFTFYNDCKDTFLFSFLQSFY